MSTASERQPCGAKVHELKVNHAAFDGVIYKAKTHEVRVNDRDFKKGDYVLLREWFGEAGDEGEYSGSSVMCRIAWITEGGTYGLPDNLCVMSIQKMEV